MGLRSTKFKPKYAAFFNSSSTTSGYISFLDESHTISQRIDTPEGSYWHAIMHRREDDFSNAKYWYRHVGQHAVYAHVNQITNVAAPKPNDFDPLEFVDRCQAVARGKSADLEVCLDIQQAEWEALFDHCYHQAIGG